MQPSFASVRRFESVILGVCILFALVTSGADGASMTTQTKTGVVSPKQEKSSTKARPDTRCSPKLAYAPTYARPRKFRFGKGETYRHSGYVSFLIDEDGKVLEPRTLTSTGVRDIDSYLLQYVKTWKYKPAPGCGVRRSEMAITVDFNPD